ncbi:hypothetical protein CTRC122_04460 [Chlamydia trachomatis RC-J(s)/122]|uniref:inclusion membrane protein InaC n=1 Tax=Chlamydia trachomatis TaxID=813 RepID=UPI00035BF716|nr:hypothetical protein [Chlamydia trachomatis]AGR98911.1 hypothetical protein CTRC3_04365 [Chlamydia trachomatis RC-L2(s)/3]AGS00798.1 hypothetical protein CTRC122_04460 [Chlamydia trachomatis RC-J(s)/122]
MTTLPNNCTSNSNSINTFTKDIEMAKQIQGSRKDPLAKTSWIAGLICVVAGVLGLLAIGIGGCSMASGLGLIGAVVAAVVVAVGLCCLVSALCLQVEKSQWWQKEFKSWIEQKSQFRIVMADMLEANQKLQSEVEFLSKGWSDAAAVHKEDVTKYEQVVEKYGEKIMKLYKQTGVLTIEKVNLQKEKKTWLEEKAEMEQKLTTVTDLEAAKQQLEEKVTDLESEKQELREELDKATENLDEMAHEAMEFEKEKHGIKPGRRGSI